MPELLRKQGRSRLTKLPDGRKQVVDRFEVNGGASDPATLATLVFIAYGTAHPKYTDCLLDEQLQLAGSGDQRITQELTRTYIESGPDTPRAIYGTAKLVYPFAADLDRTTREIRQDFIVNKSDYVPALGGAAYANEALLDPQPSGSFYCLGDYGHTDARGDSLRFTRIWSMIPIPRTRQNGTYPFRFPAIPTVTPVTGSPVAISSVAGSMSFPSGTLNYSTHGGNIVILSNPVFTTSGAHGLAVGDWVKIEITWGGGWPYASPVVRYWTVATVPSSTTFSISSFQNLGGGPNPNLSYAAAGFSSGTVTKLTRVLARPDPSVEEMDSYIVYDYALPGVTAGVAVPSDFRPEPKFRPVITATQEQTDELSALTTPTLSDYITGVLAGDYLVASSSIKPHRDSPIMERETRYVRSI